MSTVRFVVTNHTNRSWSGPYRGTSTKVTPRHSTQHTAQNRIETTEYITNNPWSWTKPKMGKNHHQWQLWQDTIVKDTRFNAHPSAPAHQEQIIVLMTSMPGTPITRLQKLLVSRNQFLFYSHKSLHQGWRSRTRSTIVSVQTKAVAQRTQKHQE